MDFSVCEPGGQLTATFPQIDNFYEVSLEISEGWQMLHTSMVRLMKHFSLFGDRAAATTVTGGVTVDGMGQRARVLRGVKFRDATGASGALLTRFFRGPPGFFFGNVGPLCQPARLCSGIMDAMV